MIDDVDMMTKVRVNSLVKSDRHGYFIELAVLQRDVVTLMKSGMPPRFNGRDFILRASVGNTATILINGMRLDCLDEDRFANVPVDKVVLKEVMLRKYSDKTKSSRSCYVTRLVASIPYVYLESE